MILRPPQSTTSARARVPPQPSALIVSGSATYRRGRNDAAMAPIHTVAVEGNRQQVLSILANDPLAVHAKTEVRACPANLLSGGKAGRSSPCATSEIGEGGQAALRRWDACARRRFGAGS